jgi:hypothetical protein
VIKPEKRIPEYWFFEQKPYPNMEISAKNNIRIWKLNCAKAIQRKTFIFAVQN